MSVVCIEGYASVFHVLDDQKDRVHPRAFHKTLEARRESSVQPKMLWQHDTLKPVGRWTHLYEDRRGLYAKGLLLLDLPQGREAWVLVHNRILDGLSIGFHAQKAVRCPKTGIRTLYQVDLLEISLVTFAAARPWTQLRCSGPIRDPTTTAPSPVLSKSLLGTMRALTHAFQHHASLKKDDS